MIYIYDYMVIRNKHGIQVHHQQICRDVYSTYLWGMIPWEMYSLNSTWNSTFVGFEELFLDYTCILQKNQHDYFNMKHGFEEELFLDLDFFCDYWVPWWMLCVGWVEFLYLKLFPEAVCWNVVWNLPWNKPTISGPARKSVLLLTCCTTSTYSGIHCIHFVC